MNIINSAPLPATGWGAAIGTGIHDVLDNLARNKAEEIYYKKQKRRTAENYEPIFGKKAAEFLAGLDPELRKVALQNPGFLQQLFAQEGGLPKGESPEQFQGAQGQYQQPNESMMSPLNNIAQPNAEQQQYLDRLANPLGTNKPQMPRFGNAEPESPLLAGLNQPALKAQAAEQKARQQGQEATDKAKLIAETFTSPEQRIRLQEQARKERKENREEENERKKEQREDEKIAREETKEYFQETIKKGKAAETNKFRATKILEKVKEGKLPNATLWNFLTHVEETSAAPLAAVGGLVGGALGSAVGSAAPGAGTIVGALGGRTLGAAIGSGIGAMGSSIAGITKSLLKSGNPDIEEIEQLSSQFILNAKQYFGARMTDFDAKSFIKTTVNLGDTPAGMEKKLNNMIEIFNLEEEEAKIAREIVRKNDNKRPIDLEDQVQERMSPKIDKLYQNIFAKK